MTTYVYEGTEVRKTGRIAVRERTAPSKSAMPPRPSSLGGVLVEIEPVDPDMSWKKWVSETQLYTVTTGDKNA